jgi:putative serine protease PepD
MNTEQAKQQPTYPPQGHLPYGHAPQGYPYGPTGAGAPPGPGRPGAPIMPGVPAGGPRPGWTLRRKIAAAGAVAAIALGAGGAGAVTAVQLTGNEQPAGVPAPATGVRNGSTVAQVAAAVQPSVVSIQAQTAAGGSGGSGVILDADGTIMTNAHVVDGADRVNVRFSDGRTARAEVLGTAERTDIAVIKAAGVSSLKPATLGDSDRLAVGDTVLAVGSPLGLDGSVTSGIVSALGRQIQEGQDSPEQLPPFLRERLSEQQSTVIRNAIQTDAAINPGNSGGALVNGAGQVIGINTAIATSGSGSGNIGLGFAIPINDARQAAEAIVSGR